LDLLGNVGLFRELKYGAYLTCYFVQFAPKTEDVFVHLILWVGFIVGCTEKGEVVLVLQE
jgi:hypothetical protein